MAEAQHETPQPGKSVLAIDKAMRDSAAYKVVNAINGFSRSIRLFEGNYQELAQLLDYFADAQRSFEMEQAGHENQLKCGFFAHRGGGFSVDESSF